MYRDDDKHLWNLSLLSAIPVFLVFIIFIYANIPRIDEIGHNLINLEKSLNRTNESIGFC